MRRAVSGLILIQFVTSSCCHRLEVAQEARAVRRKSTPEKMSSLAERRMRLQTRIDEFHQKASIYMPGIEPPSGSNDNEGDYVEGWEDVNYDSEDDDVHLAVPGTLPVNDGAEANIVDEAITALLAEEQVIRLPSVFGKDVCDARLRPHARVEFDLRKGQANDALHNIRLHVAEKSFIYGGGVRKGSNKSNLGHRGRQKAFNEVHVLESKIRHQARIYQNARKCLELLGMSAEDQRNYPQLLKSDTNASTAVVDFNARGQRNEGLSWIWRTTNTMARDSEMMSECKC